MQTRQFSATYPLVLTNLTRMRCVVVGGGAVAERKVGDLIEGGARPEVISPTLTDTLANQHHNGTITHVARRYQSGDLAGAFLAIAATDDHTVNARVAAEGEQLGILVNVADDPAASMFHTVAAIRRGDLLLTVSTNGASPTLAAHIRRELEARYGDEYAHLLTLLKQVRSTSLHSWGSFQRSRFWRRFPLDTLLAWLRNGEAERVEAYLAQQIEKEAQRDKGDTEIR